MFKFLEPYLVWIKLGLLLFVLLAAAAGGYRLEKYRFDAYKADAVAARDKQIIEAKNKEAENERNTYIVAQAYNDRADRLAAQLERLRKQSGNQGSVPILAEGASGIHESGTAASGAASCSAGFYDKALRAEMMLEAWQDWARKQHIPVE